jgi:itaconate CoA-transferase
VLMQPELGQDDRFSTNVARVTNRGETDRMVAARFAAQTGADMISALNAADVAYGQVSDLPALLTHPSLRRVAIETPAGTVLVPAIPAQVQGADRALGASPALGAHDATVRAQFVRPKRST